MVGTKINDQAIFEVAPIDRAGALRAPAADLR